jgi:hypothetical protein
VHTNKERVGVVAIVGTWRVEGCMHVLAGSRLTDSLNSRATDFLALTDAKVFDVASGALLMETPYLALNRESITMVLNAE